MKMRFLRFLLICVASVFSFSAVNAADYGTTTTPPAGLKGKGTSTNVDGYATVRLQWGFTDESGKEVFDGVSITSCSVSRAYWPLAGENPYALLVDNRKYTLFVDYEVAPGTYSYKVTLHMNYRYSLDSGVTNVDVPFDLEYVFDPITVASPRADLVTYDIKEVYNLRIGAENAANSVPAGKYIPTQSGTNPTMPLFDHIDFVRAGYHISDNARPDDGNKHFWYFYDNGYGGWLSDKHPYYEQINAQYTASRRGQGIMWKVEDTVDALTSNSYQRVFSLSNKNQWNSNNYGPMNYFLVDRWENIFTRFGELYYKTNFYYYRVLGDTEKNRPDYMLYPPASYAVIHSSNAGGTNPNPTGSTASNTTGATFPAKKGNDRSGTLKIRDLSSRLVTDANPGIAVNDVFSYTGSNQVGRCDMLSYRGYDGGNNNRTFDTGFTEVLFSPGYTPFLYRAKFNSGAVIGESWFRIPGSTTSGVENFSMFVDGEGNENRYIHLLRSNDWRYYELDPAYKDGTGDLTNHLTKAESMSYLSFPGAANQSGGATLYVKGAIAGKGLAGQNTVQCNDLFVLTPISLQSRSTGSFQLNKATTTVDNPSAKDFDVLHLSPVKVFQQREEFETGMAFNANNVCFFMAKERESDGLDHIYIYQYVPCVRVAKYEIVPRINPTSTPIDITVEKTYEEETLEPGGEQQKVDMNGFDRHINFSMPDYNRDNSGDYVVKGYDIVVTDPNHQKYHYRVGPKYESYTENGVQKVGFFCEIKYMNNDGTYEGNEYVQVIDDKGFPVWVKDGNGQDTNVPVRYGTYVEVTSIGTDESGNPIAPTVGNYVLNYNVPCPMPCLGTYESEICVYLGNKNVADDYIKCGSYKSTTTLSMVGEQPIPTAKCYKLKDYVNGTVTGENENDIYPYRVDVSFTMPDGKGSTYEPVSYYKVYVDKTGTATDISQCTEVTITPYDCMKRDAENNPIKDATGNCIPNYDKRDDLQRGFWLITKNEPTEKTSNKAPCQCPAYNYGTRTEVDRIPGTYGYGSTYGFDADWGYSTPDNQSEGGDGKTVFSIYFKDPTASSEIAASAGQKAEPTNPDDIVKNYKIYVEAVYAATTNYKFVKNGYASAGVPGTTAVDEVFAKELTVTPNPAVSDVTISASYEISDVKFYNASGALVKSETFAGDSNEVSISVDNLASGFYYLNVNGTESVKFIKK